MTLEATNFLGFSASTSASVAKPGVPAPTLAVLGGTAQETTHQGSLSLVASAQLPMMHCIVGKLANAKMDFLWGEVTGAYAGPFAATSKNPRALNVPAKSLEAGRTYTFAVVGRLADTPNLNNSALVNVYVVPQPVEAIISGGDYRQVVF